jgi:hypothetical protein
MRWDKIKDKIKHLFKPDKKHEKYNLFLGGVVFGMGLTVVVYIFAGYPYTLPYLKPFVDIKHLPPGSLNFIYTNDLSYYSGVLDTLYFQFSNTWICRYNNPFVAMQYIAANKAFYNSTIFFIFDGDHLRVAVYYDDNLTFFDVTDPTYIFYPNDTEIMSCNISPTYGIGSNCTIIYADGLTAYNDPTLDELVVKEAFHSS